MTNTDPSEHQNTSEDVAGKLAYDARQNMIAKPAVSGAMETGRPVVVTVDRRTAALLVFVGVFAGIPSSGDPWLAIGKLLLLVAAVVSAFDRSASR